MAEPVEVFRGAAELLTVTILVGLSGIEVVSEEVCVVDNNGCVAVVFFPCKNFVLKFELVVGGTALLGSAL